MISTRHTRRNRGFLLLEMILALAVFGIAATAFAVALNQMAKAASLAQSELRITRILDSALNETLSLPNLEEGETTTTVGDTGMDIKTTVKLLDDLQNEEGKPLSEMYSIAVGARWYDNGEWKERSVETWRNGRMYQSP
jgi:prepilin-type N-terminal cleavage/methylation domain-containing protein